MNIEEAKKEALKFGKVFNAEPSELSMCYIFKAEIPFDLDEDKEMGYEIDLPLCVIFKDGRKNAIYNFLGLPDDVKNAIPDD